MNNLISILIILDRIIKSFPPNKYLEKLDEKNINLSNFSLWLFEDFPFEILELIYEWKLWVFALVVFLFKQITSMWPSSDMRLIHREEGGNFRIIKSLININFMQIVWDAFAILTVGVLGILFFVFGYFLGFFFWRLTENPISVVPIFIVLIIFWPIGMAGFSFSSKIAVLKNITFLKKEILYLKLFYKPRIFIMSWIFFNIRIILSLIFVLIIPVSSLVYIENFIAKILISTISALPVYSYVKMATFKFFLEVYLVYPEIKNEYLDYFSKKNGPV